MGTLGRVLVVLNILAAAGFVYLAAADWGARAAWSQAAFRHLVAEVGLPLEAPEKAGDVGKDYVAFEFEVSPTVPLTDLKASALKSILAVGGDRYGSTETVANQSDEVKRVKAKVQGQIDGQEGDEGKRNALRTYLLNLAESGDARDGVNALLRDLFDKARAADARRELRLLGSTPTKQNALDAIAALAPLKDEIAPNKAFLVDLARRSIRTLVLAEIANVVPAGAAREQRDEQIRQLVNKFTDLLTAANAANPNGPRVEQLRESIKAEGSEGAKILADLAANPLGTKEAVDDARQKLNDLVVSRATTDSEKQALTGIIDLITNAGDEAAKVDQVGRALLNQYFDEASAPVTAPSATPVHEAGEKRRQIAHLLYHLDPDPSWQQRVQMVVGLTNYVRAVEAQANNLAAMAQRSSSLVIAESQKFVPEFQEVVQRALFLASKVAELRTIKDRQVGLTTQHNTNVNNRTQEMEDLQQELAKLKADAKKALADFKSDQDTLFQLTNDLRQAQDRLFTLEEQLRTAEAKVGGR